MSNQRIFDHALLFELQTLILSHFFECDKGITVPLKLYNNIVPLLSFFIGILLEELKKFVDFSTNQSNSSFICLLNNLNKQLSVA